MKAVALFVILFIGACIAAPNTHLLDFEHNTIVSSVTGLADSCPTLLNNPVDAAVGQATVVPLALNYGLSLVRLSESIDDLTAFIRKSTDKSATITEYIGSISNDLHDLIPAMQCLSAALRTAIDQDNNADLFKLKSMTDCLNKVTKANHDMSAAIQAKLSGVISDVSCAHIDTLSCKIDITSQAMQEFAEAVESIYGATGLLFGIIARVVLAHYGHSKLSRSLQMLACVTDDSSNTSCDKLVRALHGWAETEKKVHEAFQYLVYLT